MQTALFIVQIIISTLIIMAILLQSQGSGFGVTWQSGGEHYHTRRGMEKVVFYATIALLGLFACVALGSNIIT